MENTTLLLTALTAITALSALAKSAVDWRSARLKLQAEIMQRAAQTPAQVSAAAQFLSRRSRWSFVFSGCVAMLSFIALAWLSFGPLGGRPLTIRDAAIIGLCISNLITFHVDRAA